MVQVKEFFYDSVDGKNKLHAVQWIPDGEVKAIMQICHGIAEYIMRYDDFANYLAENGILVVGNDHLGHGQSFKDEADMGYFADKGGWDMVVSDIHALYVRTHRDYPETPYFLFGHSMGSFLARTFIIRHHDNLSGCILSGTGQQSKALCNMGLAVCHLEQLRLGKRGRSDRINSLCFGKYNVKIKPARTSCDWLSRDDSVVDKYNSDKKCGFVPTIGLVEDMLGGVKFISDKKNVDQIQKDLPIYLYSGSMDPVGDYGKGVTAAYDQLREAGCTDVKIRLYPGGRHEMHNELNKAEVYESVLNWINHKAEAEKEK